VVTSGRMRLNGKASCRVGLKAHGRCNSRLDLYFDIIAVKVNDARAIGAPTQFDAVSPPNANGPQPADKAPVGNGQIVGVTFRGLGANRADCRPGENRQESDYGNKRDAESRANCRRPHQLAPTPFSTLPK
jgi:hypothetical protein